VRMPVSHRRDEGMSGTAASCIHPAGRRESMAPSQGANGAKNGSWLRVAKSCHLKP
jgi:hypothetical protein